MAAVRSKRINPQSPGVKSGCDDEAYRIAAKLLKVVPQAYKPRRKKVITLAGAVYDNGTLR